MKKIYLALLFLTAVLLLNAQLGTITVLSPNGGETWYTGQTYPITWTSNNLTGSVYIQLVPYSSTSTQPAMTIATNVPIESGSYAWTIPATIFPNGLYKIRIVWISLLGVYIADESDAPFTITSGYVTPSITVTSPNGGENWQIGQTYPITWNYTNLTGTVRIELVSPAMTPIANIIAEAPIADGVYFWTIPNSIFPCVILQNPYSLEQQSDSLFRRCERLGIYHQRRWHRALCDSAAAQWRRSLDEGQNLSDQMAIDHPCQCRKR